MAPRTPLLLALVAAAACGDAADGDRAAELPRGDLPTLNESDPARAAAGRELLFEGWPGGGLLPRAGIDNLWIVWGTGSLLGDEFWAEFEARYGFFREPGAELPLGFHQVGAGYVSLSCLACHADRGPAGEALLGVANRRLDFRRLIADGRALAELAGVEPPEVSAADGLQASPGAIDAVGLGFRLDPPADPTVGLHYGYQQPSSWWNLRVKTRQFVDASNAVDNWRVTMATLVVFGWDESTMATYEPAFQDLQQFMFGLRPPAWSGPAPDAAAVARGEAVFDAACASCHGTYHGAAAGFPEIVIPRDEVGTDPVRSELFDAGAAAALNATWFGEVSRFEATSGYLAPPLLGVWATAPYFHDASVPDLAAVLAPAERPEVWQLIEPPAYDAARMGYAWEEAAADAPRAIDTRLPGLGRGGHDYAAGLSVAERADLLDYLKTL